MKRVFVLMLIFALLCGCAPQAPAEPAPDPDPVPEPSAPTPQPEPEPVPEPAPVFWDDSCTWVGIRHSLSLTREWHDFNVKTSELEFVGVITQSHPFTHTFREADLAVWKAALSDPNMERDENFTKIPEDSEIEVTLHQGSIDQPGLARMTLYYRYDHKSEQRRFYLCREDGPVFRLGEEAAAELYDLFAVKDLAHIYLGPWLCNDLLECPEIWTVKDPERTMSQQEAAEVLMGALTDSLYLKKACRSFVIVGGELEIRVRKYDPELHWAGEHLTQDQWCVDDLSDWEYRGISPERGLFFDSCATLEYRDGAWYLYTWYLPEGTRDLPVQEVVR